MHRFALLFICLGLCFHNLLAQSTNNLQYYLPNVSYNPAIPTPAAWLGFEVGDWHLTHDQLLGYMKALDAASDRIQLQEYGRSHENRPLICLFVSTPQNLANLDALQQQRVALADPSQHKSLDLNNLVAVNYMGYSIHGNETSGSNAAVMVAYYLAAAQTTEVEQLLQKTVVLLDPCFNPDGMQRFSSWINSHKSKNTNPDPAGDEYAEPWPRGRTNHYGFDLNRDWLVVQQPESVGRVALFQKWKPNVLTDHHEMGSNATFFFQPGVPARVNPITPDKNQELTAKIGMYHANLLSENKVLFYTRENFDDFYYGKGSTYPDVQGAIGILFEQASSRGTAQETENGILTFPYSVRNQVFVSLSTLKAVGDMRVELNQYLRDFYHSGLEAGTKSEVKGYLFSDGDEPARWFLELLLKHNIQVVSVQKKVSVEGKEFSAAHSFFVPCSQPQYRLIRAIFERPTTFRDSIFYDISAWTLPDAFGLNWSPVPEKKYQASDYSEHLALVSLHPPYVITDEHPYAYVVPPNGYHFPAALGRLLRSGVRVRVAMEPFEADGQQFSRGSLVLAADRQPGGAEKLQSAIRLLTEDYTPIALVNNGLTAEGPDLGSSQFPVVRVPKILLVTGEGVNVADAGEIWHLFDTRYQYPMTLCEIGRIGGLNLSKYNVMILADGNYGGLPSEKIRQFVQEGGTLVATGKALNWLKQSGLAPVEWRQSSAPKPERRAYAGMEEDKGALAMAGAIFEANLDLTHPLCFGYNKSRIPIFLGDTLFLNPGKNPYATPLQLTDKPLMAGYVHNQVLPMAPGAAAAVVYGVGKGKIIGFPGNPNFRAFWYGTNRLFANAVFFGNLINGDSVEKK